MQKIYSKNYYQNGKICYIYISSIKLTKSTELKLA